MVFRCTTLSSNLFYKKTKIHFTLVGVKWIYQPPYKTNFSSSGTGLLRYPSQLTVATVPAYSPAAQVFSGLSQDHSLRASGWPSHLRLPGHQLAEQTLYVTTISRSMI